LNLVELMRVLVIPVVEIYGRGFEVNLSSVAFLTTDGIRVSLLDSRRFLNPKLILALSLLYKLVRHASGHGL